MALARLHRHQLVHLKPSAWSQVLDARHEAESLDCLQHWASHGLPLIVTRQPPSAASQAAFIALGLPAPLAWGRRRIAVQVPVEAIRATSEMPQLGTIVPAGADDLAQTLCPLIEGLMQLSATAHVYGSHGWQSVTGLGYVHETSDIDLWVPVRSEQHADAVVQALAHVAPEMPRVDGELMFEDGSAVAWREWAPWRSGRTRGVLVKRLGGTHIEHGPVASWTGAVVAA